MLLLMLAAQATVASPVTAAPPDPIGTTHPALGHGPATYALRGGGHRRYARIILPLLTLLLLR